MSPIVPEGLLFGSELALIAAGLTLIFGVSRFANVAQAEFATLGAYIALWLGGLFPSLVVDVVLSLVIVSVVSIGLYHLVFKRLVRRGPSIAMIGSFAVSILVRAGIQAVVGPNPYTFDMPLERNVELLGMSLPPHQIYLIAGSVLALCLLMLVVVLTPLGRSIRAVSTNPELAEAAGIDVNRVTITVWGIAGFLGAIAGVILALDTELNLEMGFQLILPVFAVAILGGLASPGGAIVAAYLLAFGASILMRIDFGGIIGSESLLIPAGYKPAVAYVVLISVLLLRPQGLFGRATRRA